MLGPVIPPLFEEPPSASLFAVRYLSWSADDDAVARFAAQDRRRHLRPFPLGSSAELSACTGTLNVGPREGATVDLEELPLFEGAQGLAAELKFQVLLEDLLFHGSSFAKGQFGIPFDVSGRSGA
jgi:hypothetical protein